MTPKEIQAFEDWFYEESSIYAAETVGPNSLEYDAFHKRLLENEAYRASMFAIFKQADHD